MFQHYETHCDHCGEDEEYIASGGVAPCCRCGSAVQILAEKEYVRVVSDMDVALGSETNDPGQSSRSVPNPLLSGARTCSKRTKTSKNK